MRRRAVSVALLAGVMLTVATPLLAHPLGNFTINHYLGVHISAGELEIDYVLDMAEIPAFQESRVIDTDGDGSRTSAEQEDYEQSACRSLAAGLEAKVDDRPLTLAAQPVALSFPPGQGGLETLRLECRFVANIDTSGTVLDVLDTNHERRLGWREMTATSDGVPITTNIPTASTSARLTAYPEEALTTPLDQRAARIVVGEGAAAAQPQASSPIQTGRPVDAFAGLITRGDLGPVGLAVALTAAIGLGMAHALAPGHGKTIMAAYLVGTSGRFRHAAGLALSVAVSHTIGVMALAVATTTATVAFSPERVYPYLSTVSGLIVLVVGVMLLRRALQRRRQPAHTHAHSHAGHHGGHTHHHEGPAPGTPITWRSLAALGLSGGLVPSASAVVLLLGAINLGRIELGFLLILGFGLGMSLALVGVGFMLVTAGRWGLDRLEGRASASRLVRVVPVLMAVLVTGLGMVLTLQSLRNVV